MAQPTRSILASSGSSLPGRTSRLFICTQCQRSISDNASPRLSKSTDSSTIGAATTTPPKPPQKPTITQARSALGRTYSLHSSLPPPTPAQLHHANQIFTPSLHRPPHRFLKSTPNFRDLPLSSLPEVAFLGRSNVGKSSVLNALLGTKGMAHTSGKKGRTRELVAFGVGGVRVDKATEDGEEKTHERWRGEGRGAFVVLDMPGYGAGSQAQWGVEIVKYLRGRTQLRRTFVLVDAEHGAKPKDLEILKLLQEYAIPHQLLVSKIDKILFTRSAHLTATTLAKFRLDRYQDRLESVMKVGYTAKRGEGLGALGDVLGCSAETSWPKGSQGKMGIETLRWAVLQAVGLDCYEDGKMRSVEYDLQVEPPPDLINATERLRGIAASG